MGADRVVAPAYAMVDGHFLVLDKDHSISILLSQEVYRVHTMDVQHERYSSTANRTRRAQG